MSTKRLAGIIAGLMLSTASFGAMATDLVIYHSWSAPPEIAALNVLKSGLEAKGHAWSDIAIPHDTGSNVNLMSLITGGQPPNVFMESNPGVYRDIAGMGMGFPLTQWFNEQGIVEKLPAAVAASISVDGEIVKVPQALHIDGMVYYNMEVAKAAGVDPAAWTSVDAMFADFQKIRDAGYAPLAVGSQPFQVGYLTHALVAAIAGPDIYKKLYGEEVDPTALDDPAFAKTLETLRLFANEAGPEAQNRPWNETTNEVITGKALMQIHGDWMKGEWLGAGKVAGTDFGCIEIPGAQAVVVTVDAWGLLGGTAEDVKTAELDFAAEVLDPAGQAKFAAAKGSTPVRLDAPAESLDACSTEVLRILDDPSQQVQNPHNTADADWQDSIWNVVFNFWSDPDMSVEDAIAQMHENYETILG
ncbi:MAG: ABC transporter substrate-binding protein [Alphaproteobacteria bacterium]|nr:ABC transporter substrate-binding protein [Alphaproteobacteria bacterium]MBU1562428.1 ABC transporter substrate-binding protein [Alphaproteobacteria bacterium]MBU2304107.1 ABC transporter substrate-binding protein [Alphaproteobacteria bacterium]MBU2369169.1 ABC transporter substrate-binding protein [Alphaproteobacteria bacterium]